MEILKTITEVNLFVFLFAGAIRMAMGLDLKTWSSWLWVLYGFISGSSIGFLRPGEPWQSFVIGIIMAAIVLFGGTEMRRINQLYTDNDLKNVRAMMGYLRKQRIAKEGEAEKSRKKK